MQASDLHLLSPEVRRDPYPYFARLRAQDGLHFSDPPGAYLVTRYDDVVEAVRRIEDFSSVAMRRQAAGGEDRGARNVITSDPPVHTRLRNILQKEFTNRPLSRRQARIDELADQILARMLEQREFDLVGDFTIPLPVTVIAELIGVEPERKDEFKHWSDCLITVLNQRGGPAWERARTGVLELIEFFRGTIDERRRTGRDSDDILGILLRAEREEQLDAKEMLAYCTLLLAAGNETTTNLIGGMVIALLANPDQLQRLIAEPALIPNAVEEGLRYCSPVQGVFRRAVRDVALAGFTVPEGEDIALMYGSANHDAEKFPHPDRFDAGRDSAGHLGFGYGIHHCLGAHLARREARAALRRLIPLLPRFVPQFDAIEWTENWIIRGPERLPIALTA